MTTSPVGLGDGGRDHLNPFGVTQIRTTIAGARIAPQIDTTFVLKRGGQVQRSPNGTLEGYAIRGFERRGIDVAGKIYVDLQGYVLPIDDPVWVAFFETPTETTAALKLINAHNPPQLRGKAIAVVVRNEHDKLLSPYTMVSGTQPCRFKLSDYIIGGWVPTEGTCVCGRSFDTIGKLMKHLNEEWSPFRASKVSIHPKVKPNTVLRPVYCGPSQSPVYAVGQKVEPGTQVVYPTEFCVDGGRVKRRHSSTSAPTPSGTVLALIQSPSDPAPQMCEVWDPARRSVTPSDLQQGLVLTDRKTKRPCVVCRARAGEVCMEGCPNDEPCPYCTSSSTPSMRACTIHEDASCPCGMPCDIRLCKMFND